MRPPVWQPLLIFALFVVTIVTASFFVWTWPASGINGMLQIDALVAGVIAGLFILGAAVATYLWWRVVVVRLEAEGYEHHVRQLALERHYDCFARYANDLVMLLDEHGTILDVNERALEAYGYPRHELQGMGLAALRAPGAAAEDLGRWSVGGVVYETEHHRRNGATFAVEVSGRRIEIDGRVFLHAIARDISERKHAEERLRLGATVLDNLQEGILVTDGRARIISVNPAFTNITGYRPDEVIGRTPRMLRSDRHDPAFHQAIAAAIRASGHWQGEMWNRRKNAEVFPVWQTISAIRDPMGRVTGYLSIFSDLTERKSAEDRISHLAQHDAVTGLPNRGLLQEKLSSALIHARKNRAQVAVLYIDLERLKEINDALGHQVGDAVLKAVAARVTEQMRHSDIAGSMGGGEFVKVIADVANPAVLDGIVARLLRRLAEPYEIDGRPLNVTVSIGAALYPDDGADPVTLLRRADTAMHQAKETGRNALSYFSAEMERHVSERVAIESALRHAVERNELKLVYQAKVNAANGRVVGCEALLRWTSPVLGEIPPSKFVPIAEDIGEIVRIGEWVVAEVTRQIRAWQAAGLATVPVAVNVSAVQFRNLGMLSSVRAILADSGVRAMEMEFEVTEGVLMLQGEATQRTLDTFKAEGFRLSIDDFGSGYSSLGYLRNFPIDSLKIDRSFVTDLPFDQSNVEIVRAVVSLGHSLGLKTIAEGVETKEQYEFLRDAGCDEVQGYLFSRPLPAEQFARVLTGVPAAAVAH